jgi:hypothetical protein
VAQTFHVDPKGVAVSNIYGSKNNTQTFSVYPIGGGSISIVFNCHDDSRVVACLGYSPSSLTQAGNVTVSYNVNGTGTGRVALVGYDQISGTSDSGWYNVTGVNSCLSVSSGSVTASENTTGHQASFTVTNCGTVTDSWTTSCDRAGPVACNRISNSCTSAPPQQSCTTTIVYSVGAVGSGTLTLKATETYNSSQFSNSDVVTVQAGPPEIAVKTHHYDNYRTGWNQKEQTLTPTNVAPGSFGLLYQVTLDDQIDAQAVFMPHVMVNTGPYAGTTHDVVYVATENNTIYAIEPATGTVLFSRPFGNPDANYQNCGDNPPHIGITSTPVIDSATNTLYLIDYEWPTVAAGYYYLRALDLGTLSDRVNSPKLVAKTHTLQDGTTQYSFKAGSQRQRAALLEANGNIYAGFASFCDYGGPNARGWLMGWRAGTLDTINTGGVLTNARTSQPDKYLAAIWMSGYGPAADSLGNVYFLTGNTYSGYYDSTYDISESAVAVSSNLAWPPVSHFTPGNVNTLDGADLDFSAGGITLLPDNAFGSLLGTFAVAAGKANGLYLLRRTNGVLSYFSGYRANPSAIDRCWCGESYFNTGTPTVVSSGGATLMLWNTGTDINNVPGLALAAQTTLPTLSGVDGEGFFTVASSNGGQAGTGIIWAMTRHARGSGTNPQLFALNATNLATLFSEDAGPPPNGNTWYNMPVVANGLVFVGVANKLSIFGLGGN